MNTIQCQFCKSEFSTRKYMLKHQRTVKACLEIQKRFEESKVDDILNPNDLKIVKRNDGYVNLTILCQSGNEQYKRWIRMTRITKKFLPDLSIKLKKPKSELIKQGGTQTWGHPDIVPDIIKWMTELRRKRIARSPQQVNVLESEGESKEEEEIFQEFKLTLSDGKELLIPIRKDGYVNATLLCKASGKRIDNWMRLDSTKNLLREFSNSLGSEGVKSTDCLEGKYGGTFIHPDLAVQLAQWCSSSFALQVSRWIRELMLTGRVELGKEKTNEELEDIFETRRASLDYQNYLGKDVLYFFEFTPDRNGLEDSTLLDNKELHFFEFGFTSNIQQRTSSSDYPRPTYRLDKIFVYDSGFKTSLAEKYTKNICYDFGLKLNYFNKKECLKATYNDLDKVYDLISKHQIRSQEDNYMCDYEIEKMKLENERLKLRNEQSNVYVSLLKEGVITYDQFKELII